MVMDKLLVRLPLRTALIYALFASLYIILSDRALLLFFSDPGVLIRMQTYKGWAFVAVTAGLLYIILNYFDIFNHLHNSEDYAGTGIGLAIAQKAAERMGGIIRAESTPGLGSTFYLKIPPGGKET